MKLTVVFRKNEVYIDVIESVNVQVSNKGCQLTRFECSLGTLLRSDVSGQIMVRSLLSGMPECKFALNDRLVMNC